ncbi:hypothetical protein HanHA300_Chr08g0296201 [Helianthus annuus]|nr:hypothetical protein HanHA300_Chr08g0296201 [Helianthus annuus]
MESWKLELSQKRTHPLLHLARDDKERAPSIDEQRIDGALGIAFFFLSFPVGEFRPFCSKFLHSYQTACRIKSCSTRSYIIYTSSLHLCRRRRQCFGLWLM